MLQEPLTKSSPWDSDRASTIPLQAPPSHPLPPIPNDPFPANTFSQQGIPTRVSAVTFQRHVSRSPSPAIPVPNANSTNRVTDMQDHAHFAHSRGTSHSGARPSSRRALTAALELAQEAVRLDTTNDDPIGAIQAYSRSVALLSEVMERVMRGEDSNDNGRRRGGRRRSVVAKEEEVRRLKSIHDTYADRMNILSDIYHFDPSNPDALSTDQQSNSSDNELHTPSLPEVSAQATAEESVDGAEFIGSAMLAPSRDSSSTPDSSSDNTFTTDSSLPEFEMVHPPSMRHTTYVPMSANPHPPVMIVNSTASRASGLPPPRPPPSGPLPTRPRNGSLGVIPPPVPPPRVALPPPPSDAPPIVAEPGERSTSLAPPAQLRPRGNSSAHKRTGSGNRLEALQEEPALQSHARSVTTGQIASNNTYGRQPHDPVPHPRYHPVDEDAYRAAITLPPSQYLVSPAAHPPPTVKDTLPPIPTSETPPPSPRLPTPPSSTTPNASPMTPRGHTLSASSSHPFAAQDPSANVSRARGSSAPAIRADGYTMTAQMINTNTSAGTISQRRNKSSTGTLSSESSTRPSSPATTVSGSGVASAPTQSVVRLTASSLPASTASSLGLGRSRSSSQPPRVMGANTSTSEFGVRSSGPSSHSLQNSSLPRKASFPSPLNPAIQTSGTPSTLSQSSSIPTPYLPSSPLPTAQPSDPLRKPYHMMSLLHTTMTSKTGGYITRRLHVPPGVWSQGGAKLQNLPEKVRVVEILCSALEEIQNASNELTSGIAVGVAPSPGSRKDVERWLSKLEDWGGACEGVVGSAGKKLGVGEGFVAKKSGVTSWSGKFARSFDRMTNGKNLDSPATYVVNLSRLFQLAQVLDEHTKTLNTSPTFPLYASLPPDLRQALELKLKRSSEFFASVVLTFVVRDLFLLLDKFVKKGEKWLVE